MLSEILKVVGFSSVNEKKLRAKTIDTIGSMLIAISDCEDKRQFTDGVCQITEYLAQLLSVGFNDDDPQDEAIKNTLT